MPEKSKQLNAAEIELAESLSNIKQRKFSMYYVENGGNGTAAAEAAGYANPAVSACQNLKIDKVQAAIKQYAALCARNVGESRETITGREANWARADIRDYFYDLEITGEDGTPITDSSGAPLTTTELKPMNDWTKEQAQRVKKISWNRNGVVLELHDPMRANRSLAEYTGMLQKEDQALTSDDAAHLIAAAMERMNELDHTPATSE